VAKNQLMSQYKYNTVHVVVQIREVELYQTKARTAYCRIHAISF
jgi:hypothetical protein